MLRTVLHACLPPGSSIVTLRPPPWRSVSEMVPPWLWMTSRAIYFATAMMLGCLCLLALFRLQQAGRVLPYPFNLTRNRSERSSL
jgi:hypothetical protein